MSTLQTHDKSIQEFKSNFESRKVFNKNQYVPKIKTFKIDVQPNVRMDSKFYNNKMASNNVENV